jgi:hypothetical protein
MFRKQLSQRLKHGVGNYFRSWATLRLWKCLTGKISVKNANFKLKYFSERAGCGPRAICFHLLVWSLCMSLSHFVKYNRMVWAICGHQVFENLQWHQHKLGFPLISKIKISCLVVTQINNQKDIAIIPPKKIDQHRGNNTQSQTLKLILSLFSSHRSRNRVFVQGRYFLHFFSKKKKKNAVKTFLKKRLDTFLNKKKQERWFQFLKYHFMKC